ncbi:MAG: LCP family protein [Candidatus Portnoybacteria bacterium]|nr:LCP family protein [Candidatus Portnoybacteria bacterium]
MIKKVLSERKYLILAILLGLIAAGGFALSLKARWVINNINIAQGAHQYELFKALAKKGSSFSPLKLPAEEPERLDILVLGIRGVGEEFGGLLTDTILLLSIDTKSGDAAMISIPRDLWVTLPYNGSVKINELYALGFDKGGEKLALSLTKTVVSQITGVYIDGAVRVDFAGFEKLIDAVGGIDIYLKQPFIEITQWQGAGGFHLPAGWNHLSGAKALFYVRSRFSTSDFDRARRQQELLLALKDKMTTLGILSNPLTVYRILDVIGNHVKTDVDIDVSEGIKLAKTIDYASVKRLVLTTQNYLYHATAPNGAYILLPKGENFDAIQQAIQNIFTSKENIQNEGINSYHPPQRTTTTVQTFEKFEQ